MLMVQAMLGAGFSNCRDEYWHYSYGDSAWAVRVGSRECSYGLVKPPPCRRRDEQC
jgi:D-alanyl-D-alanine dipeptidase